MSHRRPLAAVAAAVVVAAGGVLLSPAAIAADQPPLECAGPGFQCGGPGRFGTLVASYTPDQPAPEAVWGDPRVDLLDSPADVLDVEPGSTVTRNYRITIPSQASPTSPHRASVLIENTNGVFAGPADMRLRITDAAGAELPDGTCAPEEQKLNPGEQTIVTCTIPEGGALLTAFRRGDFGGENLAAWRLDSQARPDPQAPGAPDVAPVVTVDGQAVTGTVNGDGTWTADVVVTRQAPDSNGAQAAYAPDVAVDGAPVTAPSFRVTTKAAAKPTPTPTTSAKPIPTASATSAPADPTATASATSASADPAAPTASAAASDPGRKGPGAGGSRLAGTGAQTVGVLIAALALAGAGVLALKRTRRA